MRTVLFAENLATSRRRVVRAILTEPMEGGSRSKHMSGVVDRMLEHPAVHALWQAPFAKRKFAPIERRIAGHAIRRILDVGAQAPQLVRMS